MLQTQKLEQDARFQELQEQNLTLSQIQAQLRDPYCSDEQAELLLSIVMQRIDEWERQMDVIEMNAQELDRRYLLDNDLPGLLNRYRSWARDDIMLAALVDGVPKGYLAAKRGNKAYVASMNSRVSNLEGTLPTIRFFETANPRDRNLIRQTHVLNAVLTYQHSKLTRYEAWARVSQDFNLFLSKLRAEFKDTIRILRSYEAHADGYPHVNVIMVFEKTPFRAFHHTGKTSGRASWRVYGHTRIKSAWEQPVEGPGVRGFADVLAVSSIEGIFDLPPDSSGEPGDSSGLPLMHAVKYITKIYTGYAHDDPEHSKGLLQTAILWAMGKRSYSFSIAKTGENLFLASIYGLEAAARLDESLRLTQNPDQDYDMENAKKFIFLGVAHYFDVEMRVKWKPPPDLSYQLPAQVVAYFQPQPSGPEIPGTFAELVEASYVQKSD